MITVFWDSQHVVLFGYLEMVKLTRLNAEQHKKELQSANKKVLFYHDNAPAHTLARLELQPYLTYSRELAPQNFFLFLNIKKSLAGQKF